MTSMVATFLAHALTLESEAAERYDELADTMEVHNNPLVSTLFRQMAGFSRRHAEEVRQRCQGHPLPALRLDDFRWTTPEPPEVGSPEGTHYLMTPWHALTFALGNERRGWEFYADAAATSNDPEVRRLAAEMAEEEQGHVATLERWVAATPRPGDGWAEDPDPAAVAD